MPMHQLLSEIEGLLILVNMFLVVIACMLFLMGWHITGTRSGCRAVAVAQEVSPLLARIERAMNRDTHRVEIARGTVLPNGRSYMAADETFRLPRGVVLGEGKAIYLSAGAA